jgi:hypothetical protein
VGLEDPDLDKGIEPLAFWMQTTASALLAVRRCSPVRMRMLAHDSRSAYGLLYFAAVQRSSHVGHDHLTRRDLRVSAGSAARFTRRG